MRVRTSSLLQTTSLLLLLSISGCRVESDQHGNADVKMATPFGGMQIKTNDLVAADGVGIPVYPGALPIKKDEKGDSNGAADVNMSFGTFQMRVKAMSYRSEDRPDKIEAFYRDALKRYGDVIACDHDRPIGTPTQTSQGLTCDNKKSNHLALSGSESGKIELKTGSQQHQHIVALEREKSGTKIGLVALDLPGHLSFGDGDGDKQ